ncbi:hypothetical protein AGMMS49975_28200 [Clostridia bacterium]|nr:hypothetical protein AGMMS49975_28200 [Clostridia bacterium]
MLKNNVTVPAHDYKLGIEERLTASSESFLDEVENMIPEV